MKRSLASVGNAFVDIAGIDQMFPDSLFEKRGNRQASFRRGALDCPPGFGRNLDRELDGFLSHGAMITPIGSKVKPLRRVGPTREGRDREPTSSLSGAETGNSAYCLNSNSDGA